MLAALGAVGLHAPVTATHGRLKVLFVSQPTIGGAAQQVLTLATRLDRQRFDVVVASPEQGWLPEKLAAAGVRHLPLGLARDIQPLRDASSLVALLGLLKRESPQIVHLHSSKAGFLGRLAAYLGSVPAVIYTPHGFAFAQARGPAGWFYLWLERFAGLLTDRIVTVSASERAVALGRRVAAPGKVVVIPNGVDIPPTPLPMTGVLRALADADASACLVAMVSRLRRPKTPEDLLRAAALLDSSGSRDRIRFAFIGSGPLEAEAKALARELHLGGRVVFLGERSDVPTLMPDIDVLVLASSSEGMPFSLLEAMAAGKPVVGSRVPGIEDLVLDGRNGFCYSPGDVEGLARILMDLAANPDLRRRLGQEGRRMVEADYTSEQMVAATQNLYETLVPPGA
jgi:glycosyltransferase involved in cell wall biosynthesis